MRTKEATRKERAAETKARIYRAAEELFAKRGFDDVSVDSIVEKAEVSKGSFYVHFDSKDALIAALLSDYTSKVDMDYKAFLDTLPADMPAPDILLALVGKIADVITGTIGCDNMRTLYKVQLTGAVDTEVVKGYGRELYGMLAEVLGRGVQRGELKTALPLDVLTKHLVMAMRGLTNEWCIRYPNFDLKEQALLHFGLLLTGIRAEAPERRYIHG